MTEEHLFGAIRVTQCLVVQLLKKTAALELELVLVNRPRLINSYEVGITAGPPCLVCS